MYASNTTEYQKFTELTPTPIAAPEKDAATRIPVSSSGEYYSDIPQPLAYVQPKPRVPWSTGLFDCFSDVRNCCITCWCPCITFGRIAEIVDKGSSSCGQSGALYTILACVTGCPCFYSCFYRSKMRQQHLLHESPCGDCCVHCFCQSCALCQEYRELKFRGFDMSIGWHGNAEKNNNESGMAPEVEEGMSR
ncbi:Protein PLANT CADMIUM RESISTANCE 2 [Abeliophyllum distichum]|uniref:Protein PLANT CADMIUM RESISTANCE 2 n=1 Tax=Abeliophyllum distichum TaxID=126358 RepID=A0ABD1U1C0_9LAMI